MFECAVIYLFSWVRSISRLVSLTSITDSLVLCVYRVYLRGIGGCFGDGISLLLQYLTKYC